MAVCKPVWANLPKPNVTHLTDIMSEQLIDQLSIDSVPNLIIDSANELQSLNYGLPHDNDVNEVDDHLMAQILQHEYDLEYDDLITMQERNLNKGSKVKISLANFRSIEPWVRNQEQSSPKSHFLDEACLERSLSEGDLDSEEDEDLQTSNKGKTIQMTPYKLRELKKVTVTKHDPEVCGRKNMGKFMTAPPGIDTGDCDGHGIKFGNPVYNRLKRHCMEYDKRRNRIHDKREKSTTEQAIDTKTRLLLYKMVNKGLLQSVSGCVSAGKEACIFHAYGGSYHSDDASEACAVPGRVTDSPGEDDGPEVPAECALKVYKTTLTDFKNREQYVRGDYQFDSRLKRGSNSKKLLKLWAEKETRNLTRMKRYGISVPSVVCLQKHVLVMEFIGKNGVPASKLKEAILSYAELEDAYSQIVETMKTLFQVCRLVHADLSEYNILWHEGRCVFIDVGQSVEPIHPLALEFLFRDCHNIVTFFSKKCLVSVATADQLFNQVTGFDLNGEGTQFLSRIQDYAKSDDYKVAMNIRDDDTSHSFDYLMDKILSDKKGGPCADVEDTEDSETDQEDDDDDTGYTLVPNRDKWKSKSPKKTITGSENGGIEESSGDMIEDVSLPPLGCEEVCVQMVEDTASVDGESSDDSSFVKIDLE